MEELFANMIIPSLITGFSFFAVGSIFHHSPPGEINGLIGYRTKSSMKSQERWDFAQEYSSRHMMYNGVALMILSALGYFLPIDVEIKQLIGVGLLIASSIVMIATTEIAIRKRFKDK